MNITTNCDSAFFEPDAIHSFFPSSIPLCGLTILARAKSKLCIALLDLDQVEDSLKQRDSRLPKQVLSEPELSYFKRFGYPKRRREWLGGRIAAKAAMLELHKPDRLHARLQQLSILPDDHGRPIADTMKNISISISHSDQFAVGLAVKGRACGIDLQQISSKLPGLTDRFASAHELTILAKLPVLGDQTTRLTMLWAAKEALKKSLLHDQPAIFSGIELQRITIIQDYLYRFHCTVDGHCEQTTMTYDFSPYILSLTTTDHAGTPRS
ncbi:MAG: 4'-phosphopantetheinyl transferase superfamily protein [Thermodesulfobacteriota bacterium]|nr:4'-phosphopantetheinyl transferase superfamily protein [Thermodesulfobacteriota bacterium]